MVRHIQASDDTEYVIAVVDEFNRTVGYFFKYQQSNNVIKVDIEPDYATSYYSKESAKRAVYRYKNYSVVCVYDTDYGDELLERLNVSEYPTHLEVVPIDSVL